jgi:hypothetical protein
VAKLEARMAIAQQLAGAEVRELVGVWWPKPITAEASSPI